MRTEYRNDPTVDTADLPYGWHKGDTCVMITNKAKKSTSEYIVESYSHLSMAFQIASPTPEPIKSIVSPMALPMPEMISPNQSKISHHLISKVKRQALTPAA